MKLSAGLIAGMGLMAAVGLAGAVQAATPADTSSSSSGSSASGMAVRPSAPTQSSDSRASSTSAMPSGTSATSGSMNSADNGATNMAPKDVMALQQALQQKGENVKPDGVWGPTTQAALKHYQQQSGLPATGQLDQATRAKLNLSS